MRIPAGSSYSDAVYLSNYESLSLTATTETLACNISVSSDGSVWQALTSVPQTLTLRQAWQVPAKAFDYKYLRVQAVAVDYDRYITPTLTDLETGGIPVGAGVGQFVYAAAAGLGLAPELAGAGLEIPAMRDGTPATYMCKITASAPTGGDDINDGYNVMSLWFDTTTGNLYVCKDPSAGSAIWELILQKPATMSGTGIEVFAFDNAVPGVIRYNYAVENPDADDDLPDGFNYNSFWLNYTTEGGHQPELFVCVDPTQEAAVWKGLILKPALANAGIELPAYHAGVAGKFRYNISAGAPTAADDTTAGYVIGSLWFDTANGDLYVCVTTTADNAVWRRVPLYQADGALRLGGTSHYVNIAADGTLTLVGDARTYDDEVVDAYNLKTVGPGVSLNTDEGVIEFVHTAQVTDYCTSNTQFKHNRALLEHVDPHIHFFQAEDAVPNFMMYYRWQKNGAAKVTAWTPYKCNTKIHTYTSGTIHQIVEGAGIAPPTGTTLSDILQIRICRDHDNASTLFTGEDPYAGTAGVLSVDIHRVIDSLGSAQEYIK